MTHAFNRGPSRPPATHSYTPPTVYKPEPKVEYTIIPWSGKIHKSPWKIFLDLVRFSIYYGDEKEYYGAGLAANGWTCYGGHVWIKNPGKQIVMMSHLDTVCKQTMPLTVRVTNGLATATEAPIGGDDRAGTALILYLSQFRDDITYILTTGEEHGCVGFQRFLHMRAAQELLQNKKNPIKIAMSLDRKEYDNLVTHMMGQMLCNHKMAEAFEIAMYETGMIYNRDSSGASTDSYQLSDVTEAWIVNLSVGYWDAHSKDEVQDLQFLNRLGLALRKLNVEFLLAAADEVGPRDMIVNNYRKKVDAAGNRQKHGYQGSTHVANNHQHNHSPVKVNDRRASSQMSPHRGSEDDPHLWELMGFGGYGHETWPDEPITDAEFAAMEIDISDKQPKDEEDSTEEYKCHFCEGDLEDPTDDEKTAQDFSWGWDDIHGHEILVCNDCSQNLVVVKEWEHAS